MPPRTKKLIGTFVLLLWLPFYALVAMGIGVHVLPHAAWFVALVYYALAGTLWIFPIGLMLPWMHRECCLRTLSETSCGICVTKSPCSFHTAL